MPEQAVEFSVVEQIIERLGALDGVDDAVGVLELASPKRLRERKVTCAVYPAAADAGESLAPEISALQQHTATIAVAISVPAPNDPRGSARTRRSLGAAVRTVRHSLNGWKPGGLREVMTWRSGRIVSLDGGRALWEDRYQIAWIQQDVQP